MPTPHAAPIALTVVPAAPTPARDPGTCRDRRGPAGRRRAPDERPIGHRPGGPLRPLGRALQPGVPLLVFASALAAAAAGQTPHEPSIVVAVYAGAITGHQLWSVDRQPVCQLINGGGGTFTCSGTYDTVALSRTVEASLSAGLTVTYFVRRALGVQFDLSYLGLPVNTRCTPVNVSSATNQALCTDIGSGLAGSSIGFDLGLIARHPPGPSNLSPYLRAGVGLVTHAGSTVEVVGSFVQGGNIYTREVIVDNSPRHTSASLTLGGGVLVSLSPGYAFRLEARDVYTSLAQVVSPANALGIAPTTTRSYHHLLLSLGFGIVLEQKRGRRY